MVHFRFISGSPFLCDGAHEQFKVNAKQLHHAAPRDDPSQTAYAASVNDSSGTTMFTIRKLIMIRQHQQGKDTGDT